MTTKTQVWVIGLFSAVVLACWVSPRLWYRQKVSSAGMFWLAERTNIAAWQYHDVPVSDEAERLLLADRLFNGEYLSSSGAVVRVFSAKRYEERPYDLGLFVHTPDRCWTRADYGIEPAAPQVVEMTVHGHKMLFERRLYTRAGVQELAYFGGLVGGRPLPFRLDHNLSVALRARTQGTKDDQAGWLRASDRVLWRRVWEAFSSRTPMLGPKQLVRLSTTVKENDLPAADRLLSEFLSVWLTPVDYQTELQAWHKVKS